MKMFPSTSCYLTVKPQNSHSDSAGRAPILSKDSKCEPVSCRLLLLILRQKGGETGSCFWMGAGCIRVTRNQDFTGVLLLQSDVFPAESGWCSGTKWEATLFKSFETLQPSQILYTSQWINQLWGISALWERTQRSAQSCHITLNSAISFYLFISFI